MNVAKKMKGWYMFEKEYDPEDEKEKQKAFEKMLQTIDKVDGLK